MEEFEFKRVYDTNAKKLYNFILWTTGNKSVCDDILQNVFVKIWRCAKAPPAGSEQTAWMYTIARNACIDHFRSAKRCAEYDDAVGGTASGSDREDDGKLAWSEVTQLPRTERSIVYLHVKMGYSYGEIAGFLNMTESNVRVKAFRALRRLRDILVKKGL